MAQKLLQSVLATLFAVALASTLAFFALRILPGNAIDAQLAGSGLPLEIIEARKETVGIGQPISQQFFNFWLNLLQGDLGESLYTGQAVIEILKPRFASTLCLSSFSLLLSILMGMLIGIISGINLYHLRPVMRLIIDLSIGIPVYLTATVLLLAFASRIGGTQTNLLLPVLALGFHSSGAIARIIDVNFEEIRHADFIKTARAKGIPEKDIIRCHMLPIVILPVLPIIGVQAGILFSGTVITETIFGRAGLGLLLLDATLQRNYPVVQGIVIVVVTVFIFFNAVTDMLMQLLDPRLELS